MNDALITVVGFVAADPHFEILSSGTSLLSLRVGSTPRRYDRELGQWRDDDPMFLTATCWRALADNLQACELKRGDPIIVTGKLRIREYVKDGERRFSAQIEATTVGHDLSRGIARFQRAQRGTAGQEDRRLADDLADRWLQGGDENDPNAPTQATNGDSEDGDLLESGDTFDTTDGSDHGTFRAVA